MKCNKIYISEDKEAYIETYLISNSEELHPNMMRPMVIVCPGGGYKYLSDREGEPMALAFNAMGIHSVVLRYSCGEKAKMPRPLKEIAYTMAYVKEHASEWYVNPDKIFVCGFSAGAHVAASLGILWNSDEFHSEYKGCHEKIKPAGMILGYPVIDLKSTSTRLDIGIQGYPEYDDINFDMRNYNIKPEDTFIRENGKTYINFELTMNAYMFGGYASDEQIEKYSLQKHVTEDAVPAFIWHGGNDGLIFPRNSMMLANALMDNGISVELHIFGCGDHGLGLANDVTSNNPWENNERAAKWIQMAEKWIKDF